MSKPVLLNFVKSAKTIIGKYSPEILTGIGIAGMITTTILAVKATPKALKLLEDEKTRRIENDGAYNEDQNIHVAEPMTKLEIVKTCWKPYIPATITCVGSTACLIAASSVSAKRITALSAAYKLSETALTEYKEKVVETIGEKKEQEIRKAIKEDKIVNNPVSTKEVLITEKGNTLCYDIISGRYFKSDIDKIKKAENILNKRMMNEMYISLNEMYDELGLSPTKLGNELGWNLDDGLIDFDFSSHLADDGTPCLAVDYAVAPRYDYSKLS